MPEFHDTAGRFLYLCDAAPRCRAICDQHDLAPVSGCGWIYDAESRRYFCSDECADTTERQHRWGMHTRCSGPGCTEVCVRSGTTSAPGFVEVSHDVAVGCRWLTIQDRLPEQPTAGKPHTMNFCSYECAALWLRERLGPTPFVTFDDVLAEVQTTHDQAVQAIARREAS